jgi:hypothetical protein
MNTSMHNISRKQCSDSVLGQHSTKSLYSLLLDSDDHVIKIAERNVDIDYSVLFKNVSVKFIDKFSRVAYPVDKKVYKFYLSIENNILYMF